MKEGVTTPLESVSVPEGVYRPEAEAGYSSAPLSALVAAVCILGLEISNERHEPVPWSGHWSPVLVQPGLKLLKQHAGLGNLVNSAAHGRHGYFGKARRRNFLKYTSSRSAR